MLPAVKKGRNRWKYMFDISFSKDHIQYHLQMREASEHDANLHIGSKYYAMSLEGSDPSRLTDITHTVKAALESSTTPINAEGLCLKLTELGMSDIKVLSLLPPIVKN